MELKSFLSCLPPGGHRRVDFPDRTGQELPNSRFGGLLSDDEQLSHLSIAVLRRNHPVDKAFGEDDGRRPSWVLPHLVQRPIHNDRPLARAHRRANSPSRPAAWCLREGSTSAPMHPAGAGSRRVLLRRTSGELSAHFRRTFGAPGRPVGIGAFPATICQSRGGRKGDPDGRGNSASRLAARLLRVCGRRAGLGATPASLLADLARSLAATGDQESAGGG
jgi:hypothetical protein